MAPSTLCPPSCNACSLRSSGAFTNIQPEELQFIETFRTGTHQVNAGGTILYEQKPNEKLFTLYSGWAFRYKTLSDGRRQILNFLLPGDFIGLQQKFADGAAHGIEAVTDVALCVFPRDGLWALFREYPALSYDITWLAARGEGLVDENLLTNGRRNATERVAMLLLQLYRRLERIGMQRRDPDGLGGSIEFPLNQQHIADALGLSLVHTNKTLRRLQQLGLHELANGRLHLRNMRALERIADYYETHSEPVPLV